MFQRKVKLPTTLQAFDDLVTLVGRKYKLEDLNHAAAIIAGAIQHLPPTQAYVTYEYLGHYVIKNIANYVAKHKSQTLQHEHQINLLVSLLETDPGDTEARDKLQTAANQGSTLAKDALSKLEEPSATILAG